VIGVFIEIDMVGPIASNPDLQLSNTSPLHSVALLITGSSVFALMHHRQEIPQKMYDFAN